MMPTEDLRLYKGKLLLSMPQEERLAAERELKRMRWKYLLSELPESIRKAVRNLDCL